MAVVALAGALAFFYLGIAWVAFCVVLLVLLFLVFRDPQRRVPAEPLGVVSPVDGQVISVDVTDKGVLHGEARVIRIRIDALGTYTARAPVEGKIMDLRAHGEKALADFRTNALWLQTDEGDDVVLQFAGYRFGLPPRSFMRFGERVGQGQRCANLRLTRVAELHLPSSSRVLVEPGDAVVAGSSLIGRVPAR